MTGAACILASAAVLVLLLILPALAQTKGPATSQGNDAVRSNGPHDRAYPPRGPRSPKGGGNDGKIGGGGVVNVPIPVAIEGANPASRPAKSGPAQKRSAPPPRRPAPPPQSVEKINIPPATENRFSPDEVVLEFAADQPPQAISGVLQRHQLIAIETASLALTDTTFVHAQIGDGRPVATVLAALANETALRTAQPNYRYDLVEQARNTDVEKPSSSSPVSVPDVAAAGPVTAGSDSSPVGGDPMLYAWSKLRLGEAHRLARGQAVLVAVIDSGVDTKHPDLAGAIAENFDAIKSPEPPHTHGTAIAGAIAAQSPRMGVAPGAQILAIRAFSGSIGFSFAILKGIDLAVARNARIINMSFAGPLDPATARQLAAAYDRGLVLVAAAGNLGPLAPPQYPAANPNVIAVSATDSDDKIYSGSNRGTYVALAAPGVDVRLPAPNGLYQVTSGTSFSAAYVSGVAALVLERKPSFAPDEVLQDLQVSAKDLGPRGKDDQFGAGRVDAYQALLSLDRQNSAVVSAPSASAPKSKSR